jgi:hypothetical protein
MEAAGVDKEQHEYKPWLIKVLVYELLLGNKKITGGGAGPRLVKASKEKLSDALAKILEKKGVKSVAGLLPDSDRESLLLPKYARVNTLKTSVEKVAAALKAEGWQETSFENLLHAIDEASQRSTERQATGNTWATKKEENACAEVGIVDDGIVRPDRETVLAARKERREMMKKRKQEERGRANGRAATGSKDGSKDAKDKLRIFARDKDLHDVLLFPPGAHLEHDDALIASCQVQQTPFQQPYLVLKYLTLGTKLSQI